MTTTVKRSSETSGGGSPSKQTKKITVSKTERSNKTRLKKKASDPPEITSETPSKKIKIKPGGKNNFKTLQKGKFKKAKSFEKSSTEKTQRSNKIQVQKKLSDLPKVTSSKNKIAIKPGVKSNFKSLQKSKLEKVKSFGTNGKEKKPANWTEYKKQIKELRLKRKQNKSMSEVITKAKQMGEKLRCKKLPGGQAERDKLVEEVHSMLSGNYLKFVLAHDTARIVQYVLKFGNEKVRQVVSKELVPSTVLLLQSKYGKFCVKKILKYGSSSIRSSTMKATYGNAVKLTSHAVSAPIFEYAYSTWAQPMEKVHLIQEFFGDMYRQSKDDGVKHLRDVYKNSNDMKSAALGAAKANLSRILNKDLLDSGLVQSVLSQYLTECGEADRSELISQLAPHAVILSNSKDGARVVMQCIWNGTNKDRKVAMKAIKQNVLDICKHEHGHCAIIALLDATDDTVLLNKMIISEIIAQALNIVKDEWGRKVMLWLVAPGDLAHFHPIFTKELEAGCAHSSCKKSATTRRGEILTHSSPHLLASITSDASVWLKTASTAVVALAVLKTGDGDELKSALQAVVEVIVDSDWLVKKGDMNLAGIEDAGLHMILRKLSGHDKIWVDRNDATFGEVLLEKLTDDVLKAWITLNRSCFLLVTVFENGSSAVRDGLKKKLDGHLDLLREQSSRGSQILLEKLK